MKCYIHMFYIHRSCNWSWLRICKL